MPDPDSLIQLPWKPEVGWLAADLVDGWEAGRAGAAQPAQAPIKDAARDGLQIKTGVECEFFLITPDGAEPATPPTGRSSPATTSRP